MSSGWYEAATDAYKVKRWIAGESWVGLVMGEFDVAHDHYKAFVKTMREQGLKARVVSIGDGSIGMNGMGANLVKRSVIIVPERTLKYGVREHPLYEQARDLERLYW